MRRLVRAALLLSLFWSAGAFATDGYQMHLRVGPLAGEYKGFFSGSYMVPATFDLEFETFYNYKNSYYFRFTMALDNPESRPFYTFAGIGHKFYMNDSRGIFTDSSDQKLAITVRNRVSYYLAVDSGVSQVITKSFGSTLQAVSSLLEFGLYVGGNYMLTPNFGVEAQTGGTYGYGFSSTAVNGITVRGLVGVLYCF